MSSSSSFGCSRQGVATADSPSPFCSLVCVFLRHFHCCHVLTYRINLLLGLPRFLFSGSCIVSILLPIYPASFLSACPNHLSLASRYFLSKTSKLRCPSDVLTRSWFGPFSSLLTQILTSSILPPPAPPPVLLLYIICKSNFSKCHNIAVISFLSYRAGDYTQ